MSKKRISDVFIISPSEQIVFQWTNTHALAHLFWQFIQGEIKLLRGGHSHHLK